MSYLKTWRELFVSSGDLMHKQMELHKESLEALKALAKAVTESTVSTDESNERLEKLIGKVESYFGSGEGLDYEN
jgi:predicted RecB family endonuclease